MSMLHYLQSSSLVLVLVIYRSLPIVEGVFSGAEDIAISKDLEERYELLKENRSFTFKNKNESFGESTNADPVEDLIIEDEIVVNDEAKIVSENDVAMSPDLSERYQHMGKQTSH